jgi:hypothetical protein
LLDNIGRHFTSLRGAGGASGHAQVSVVAAVSVSIKPGAAHFGGSKSRQPARRGGKAFRMAENRVNPNASKRSEPNRAKYPHESAEYKMTPVTAAPKPNESMLKKMQVHRN